MSEEQEFYRFIGQQIENAEESQMFGKPCFKVKGKAFVCFFQNEMVFKLTEEAHAMALGLDGAQLFDPSGKNRPMKEWVQVPYKHKSYWAEYAASAFEYIHGKH